MAWVKLTDSFFSHPKILAAGKDGRALYIAALCYSSQHLTDGAIHRAALPVIAQAAGVRAAPTARQLCAVGLWHESENGWEIHDYHDHQPTAAEVRDRREKRSQSGRMGGLKSRPPGSKDGSKCFDDASNASEANRNPVPSRPVVPPSPPRVASPETPPEAPGDGTPDGGGANPKDTVDAAIEIMAECDLRRAQADGTPIRNATRWKAKAAETRRGAHGELLAQLATEQPGIDPADLAEQVDPTTGPLDGGHARAEAAWQQTQADTEADMAERAANRDHRRRADEAIAALDDAQRSDLEARARDHLGAAADGPGAQVLVRNTMRNLALTGDQR